MNATSRDDSVQSISAYKYLTRGDQAAIDAIHTRAQRRYLEDELLLQREEHERMIEKTDRIREERALAEQDRADV